MTKYNFNESENVYLIAEIGSNHNQDKNLALEMIDMASQTGADAVKFQSIRFDRIYQTKYETMKFRKFYKQIELDENWYLDLAKQAKKADIDFISCPTYLESIDLLEECDVPLYKIASPQAYGNLEIVRRVAQTGKPLIISLGYCEYDHIGKVIKVVEDEGNDQITLLHCISKYPMNATDANLRFIQTLQKMTGYPVGFSDHSLDDHLSIAAVAMGACVIEKHVTLDRNMSGPDHNFAMTFNEFSRMESRIRDISLGLGSGVRSTLLKEEYDNRKNFELKTFSKVNIKKGEQIDESMLIFKLFSGNGILKSDSNFLCNLKAKNNIDPKNVITWNDVDFI
jgi:sialic acid synthase SpsE